jgi:hypothetical protein
VNAINSVCYRCGFPDMFCRFYSRVIGSLAQAAQSTANRMSNVFLFMILSESINHPRMSRMKVASTGVFRNDLSACAREVAGRLPSTGPVPQRAQDSGRL